MKINEKWSKIKIMEHGTSQVASSQSILHFATFQEQGAKRKTKKENRCIDNISLWRNKMEIEIIVNNIIWAENRTLGWWLIDRYD